MRAVLAAAAAALTVSACASGMEGQGYSDRLDALEQSCRERGGVLTPSSAPQTGRPEVDHHCRITGGASRIGG